jgi:hypothetical protein
MSWVADDWSLGILPLQHLAYKTEKNLPLDLRHVLYACRMGRRRIDDGQMGHYVVEPGSAGDILGSYLWETASEELRPISGWAFAWPAVATVEQKSQTTTGFSVVSSRPSRGASSSSSSSPVLFPIFDKSFRADKRFAPQSPAFPGGKGTCYPKPAGGTIGIVLDSTKETSQEGLFFTADPRMVAVNHAGDPECSSIVTDLDADSRIDVNRCAPLHTAWRVVRPVGGIVAFSKKHPSLAWQMGRSGQDGIEGLGLVYDSIGGPALGVLGPPPLSAPTGSGSTVPVPPFSVSIPPVVVGPSQGIVAACSVQAGGFIDVGARGDTHELAKTLDGEVVNSAHISTLALFRGHGGDGPLAFEGVGAAIGPKWPFLSQVRFGFMPGMPYQWNGQTKSGKWRWWSYTMFDLVGQPPGKPPTKIPPDKPGEKEPPPGEPGEPVITGDPIEEEDRRQRELDQKFGPRFRKRVSGEPHEPFGGTTLPLGIGALLIRPEDTLHSELPDLRKMTQPSLEDSDTFRNRAPVTMRIEGFTKQTESGDPVYGEKPSRGRYAGGTASGGAVVCPPEMDIVNALDPNYSDPTEGLATSPNGSISSLIFLPGVRLSFGLPNPETGLVRTGGAELLTDGTDLLITGARTSVDKINLFRNPTTVEILGGIIGEPATSNIVVDTEGGIGTDELDTIGEGTTGDLLVLSTFSGRVVDVMNATGNLYLSTDFSMVSPLDKLVLISLGFDGWAELSRSSN